MSRYQTITRFGLLLAFFLALAPAWARAADAWLDPHFAFRRPVEVDWDWDHPSSREIATVNLPTAGHIAADSDRIVVATNTGIPVASRMLMLGPGDCVRVAFALSPGIQHYYIYFGNAKNSPATIPDSPPELKITSGFLLETRQWTANQSDTIEAIVAGWEKSGPLIGRAIVDRPFVAGSPFGEQKPTVSRFVGEFFAPDDGRYLFAASIGSHGALFIDDKPVLYVPMPTSQAQFEAWVPLTQGHHTMTVYQVYDRQPAAIAIGWQRPGMTKIQILGRDAVGVVSHGQCGALQTQDQKFAADYLCEYLGECSVGLNYSHRCRFIAALPSSDQSQGQPISVHWDFGDGLSGDGAAIEHVFLGSGVYQVHVSISAGPASDSQTIKVSVDRDWEHPASLLVDPAKVHAEIAAGYDLTKISIGNLPTAGLLMAQAQNPTAALGAAARLASTKSHPRKYEAINALQQITQILLDGPAADKVLDVWDQIPPDSDLNPFASVYHAQLCLWWTGDFDKAVQFLQPVAEKFSHDRGVQCAYGQALILDNQSDKGREILLGLPSRDPLTQRAALSGAMARTVEYYVDQKDWQDAQDAWDKWSLRFPDTFLEGYSVFLRAQIMVQRDRPAAAAKLAQAFVAAEPQSPYCPQLLEFAAKSIDGIDAATAAKLRQTLKDHYPEEPISP